MAAIRADSSASSLPICSAVVGCRSPIGLGVVGVRRGQRLADCRRQSLPVVRIEPVVRIPFSWALIGVVDWDDGGTVEPGRRGVRARHDPSDPGVQARAALDHKVGRGHRPDVARCRLVVVGIDAGAEEPGHGRAIAGDRPRDVGERGGRRDDPWSTVTRLGALATSREQADRGDGRDGEEGSAAPHGWNSILTENDCQLT